MSAGSTCGEGRRMGYGVRTVVSGERFSTSGGRAVGAGPAKP